MLSINDHICSTILTVLSKSRIYGVSKQMSYDIRGKLYVYFEHNSLIMYHYSVYRIARVYLSSTESYFNVHTTYITITPI